MKILRPILLVPVLAGLMVTAAMAAPAKIVVAPAAPETTAEPAAPAPVQSAGTATSTLVITLGTTGEFERKSVHNNNTGDADSLTVDYINAPPNYLALLPIDGTTLVFNTVLAASGAKYAAGKYVFWSKGTDANLYDETQGANAKPILSCAEVNDTP